MKRIEVKHLARVEGDGGILVEMEGNQVKTVKVKIFEGPRLIEALAKGKSGEEVASFTPRICAICTVSHKNASIRAVERALSYHEGRKLHYTRELMHLGEMIESHSLHVFALALPDFLGYPDVVSMAEKYGDVVVKALSLKKFGNYIMKTLNGKFIHGENAKPGGFDKYPTKDELLKIKKEAQEFLPFMIEATNIVGDLEMPSHLERETTFIACNPKDYDTGEYRFGFWSDEIIISDNTVFPAIEYKNYLKERVVPHSFAKRSQYKGKPFSVGALARLITIGERLQNEAKKLYMKYKNLRWYKNIMYNNLAQCIEIVYCLERIPEVIDILLKIEDNPVKEKPTKKYGRGVGAVEAPRGLLIHDYTFEDKLIKEANIITPTAFNLDDTEAFIKKAAEELEKTNKTVDEMRFEFEKIARAYDPCISCATHLVDIVKK